MPDLENRIQEVDWRVFAGPDHYQPDAVAPALLRLLNIQKRTRFWNVYNLVIGVVGNNHAGTYYPAIIEAIHFIGEISLSEENALAAEVAAEILIDFRESFCAEVGTYSVHSKAEIESLVRGYEP